MKKILSILFLLTLLLNISCRKDKVITDKKAKLSFSQDSILYDTVFTQIGSTTKLFTVHNNNSGKINISSLRLARGNASFFRLNVDGQPGKSFTDIEIAAHDSVYIFVEVTINPNYDPSVSPFIYRDSILFETNGNAQDVKLVAFGQNAYYHMPNKKLIFSSTQAFYYGLDTATTNACTVTWKNDKPHLIYGYLVVDSAHNLIIPAGTKIYVHNSGGLWVYRYGRIQINGVHNNEVVFQGDRLEAEYKDLPGQWDRIWINEGSSNNVIDYAIIKNGFIGVQAGYSLLDGLDLPYLNNTIGNEARRLFLTNTIIQNCSFAGLLAHNYTVTGGNDVIANCGKYLGVFQYGGSYTFRQCTFANYWTQTNNSGNGSQQRTTPSFFFNNYVSGTDLPFDSLWFGNCMMGGSLAEEFQFDTSSTQGQVHKMMFDHCSMSTQMNTSGPHFNTPINWSPSFVDASIYNFHLNSNSSAVGTGASTPSAQGNWVIDIEGNSRSWPPDLGAYKF